MKKITQKTLAFYFALLTFITTHHNKVLAQGRWKPGYIVLSNKDTLFGQIAYIEKAKSPKSIVFRKGKKEEKKRFLPAKIRSFKVQLPLQDLYFKTFTADIDISPVNLATLDHSPEPIFQKNIFFAQLLISGTNSLYTCTDTTVGKEHFFIESPDGALTELINKRYYIDDNNVMSADNDAYKKQLSKFYSGCSEITIANLNNVEYKTSSLSKLAKDYNKCSTTGITSKYEYKIEKIKLDFGIDLGVNSSSTKVDGDNSNVPFGTILLGPVYNGIKFPVTYSFNEGIFLNVIAPHTEKRWSVYNELLYTHYDMQSNEYVLSGNYLAQGSETAKTHLKVSYVNLITAVRYQYGKTGIKPFFQLGIMNGYAVSVSTSTLVHDKFSSQPDMTQPFMPFRKYEQSLLGSGGVRYKKYEMELRYIRGNGFSEYPSVKTVTSHFMFLLKYSLF